MRWLQQRLRRMENAEVPHAQVQEASLLHAEVQDAQAADLVKLRYIVGLTMQECADALNLPLRTAERLWTFAKTWLYRELQSPC